MQPSEYNAKYTKETQKQRPTPTKSILNLHKKNTVCTGFKLVDLSDEDAETLENCTNSQKHAIIEKYLSDDELGYMPWSIEYAIEREQADITLIRKQMVPFINYVFNDGLNLTVRRGKKEYNLTEEYELALVNHNDTSIRNGKVIRCEHLRFCDITNEHLKVHHDPNIRTTDALLTAMQEYYDDFAPDEIVTLLYFNYDTLQF